MRIVFFFQFHTIFFYFRFFPLLIRNRVAYLKEITSGENKQEFASFHKFVFRYHLLKPGQKTLDIESVIILINIAFKKEIAQKFVKFLRITGKKVLNEDQWCNMIEVFPLLEQGLDKYDAASSCTLFQTWTPLTH